MKNLNNTSSSTSGSLKSFYENQGWNIEESGNTHDAFLFEDLRPVARSYIRNCRLRVLRYLPSRGNKILDAASGPIQYPEYLEYSKAFKIRVCVDISQKALDGAREKIGEHGEFVLSDIEKLPFDDNCFDSVISLHTLYHVQADHQSACVQELLRVVKSGSPVLVVYSNPFPWHSRLVFFVEKKLWERPRLLRFFRNVIGRDVEKIKEKFTNPQQEIYFHSHSLEWWKQFENFAEVEFVSWRFLTAEESKKWLPDNYIGRVMFTMIALFERLFPLTAARWCAYPLIFMRKRKSYR